MAVGTSLGAGAIGNLVCREPERFERMVWLLPAGLDLPFGLAEPLPPARRGPRGQDAEEALETVLNDPARVAEYVETPWRLELDRVLWQHDDPDGLARAIHGVVEDWPIPDRELLRDVATPTIIVTIEGDEIHPAELGRLLAELLPNAELIALGSQEELLRRIPELVVRVSAFIAGEDGAGQRGGERPAPSGTQATQVREMQAETRPPWAGWRSVVRRKRSTSALGRPDRSPRRRS